MNAPIFSQPVTVDMSKRFLGIKPQDIFKVQPNLELRARKSKIEDMHAIPATRNNIDQAGRAAALLPAWEYARQEDGWHVIYRPADNRFLRVGITVSGKRMVEELNYRACAWQTHPISDLYGGKIKTSLVDGKSPYITVSGEATWHFRGLLKESGLHWQSYARYWVWLGDTLPSAVQSAVIVHNAETEKAWTKYHILALMLTDRTPYFIAPTSQHEALREEFQNAYYVETWKSCGYNMSSFPSFE